MQPEENKSSASSSIYRTLTAAAFTGLALFFYFDPQVFSPPDGQVQGETVSAAEEQASFSMPARFKIPIIDVDAAVEHVGLTPDGAMAAPKNMGNVAWYKLGPRPGEEGSAVIAGHFGWKNGTGSVFDNLHKLRPGDKVYVEDDKGMIVSFVVVSSRRYDPLADASGVFGSLDGKVHLNLVTCEGDWDEARQTYSKRLVVFTEKE